ncbi:hypothetical protein PILCRDRAFT_498488 [Piloderma croceum F 1598]|uniref:Uncharacterized protein n=1 Tax=Piloderma croceum (strain F 1598) TaxID=765440 RepID=A0A0C3BWC8_PILCF|nr:hypothetical protein PILCRDRAFT_498488 [Piloderma croceum F 1598]
MDTRCTLDSGASLLPPISFELSEYGSESVESFWSEWASASTSLEPSGRDGVYNCPRRGALKKAYCSPSPRRDRKPPPPLQEVNLPLAQLELLYLRLCLPQSIQISTQTWRTSDLVVKSLVLWKVDIDLLTDSDLLKLIKVEGDIPHGEELKPLIESVLCIIRYSVRTLSSYLYPFLLVDPFLIVDLRDLILARCFYWKHTSFADGVQK